MKRIKILCVILLIVFIGNIYQGAILPLISGAKYGISVAEYQISQHTKIIDFPLLDVTPKNKNFLGDKVKDQKTKSNIIVKPEKITVITFDDATKPFWWDISQTMYYILSIVAIMAALWIPFLVFKIIRSLQHSVVFDRSNLKKIHKIGVLLLVIGVLETILQFVNIVCAKSIISLSNYDFSYRNAIDFNPILMGIIILLMNEVLRIGTDMKEEQDLTI